MQTVMIQYIFYSSTAMLKALVGRQVMNVNYTKIILNLLLFPKNYTNANITLKIYTYLIQLLIFKFYAYFRK